MTLSNEIQNLYYFSVKTHWLYTCIYITRNLPFVFHFVTLDWKKELLVSLWFFFFLSIVVIYLLVISKRVWWLVWKMFKHSFSVSFTKQYQREGILYCFVWFPLQCKMCCYCFCDFCTVIEVRWSVQ